MKVCIVGLGLIGGSIGIGLVESGFAETVVGIDRELASAEEALHRKAIHSIATAIRHVTEVDLWVVATPPNTVAGVLTEIAAQGGPDAAVTDCASVKGEVCAQIPPALAKTFVGGHPMAGHDQGSIYNARSGLFCEAPWLLTPHEATDPRALDRVRKMVYALDAIPVCMPPDAHDEHAALLSHVPHVLAAILMLQANGLRLPHLGGGSWRDLTRVAASDPKLWSEILTMNAEAVEATLSDLENRIAQLRSLVRDGRRADLADVLQRAAELKRKLHGDPPQVQSDL